MRRGKEIVCNGVVKGRADLYLEIIQSNKMEEAVLV